MNCEDNNTINYNSRNRNIDFNFTSDIGSGRPVAAALALRVLVFAASCVEPQERDFIPTGVQKKALPNGNTEFIATARASQNAIEKGMAVMMQATSREGARLLLKNALIESGFSFAKFKRTGIVFLRKGEYCRMSGVYYPKGVPKPKIVKSKKAPKRKGGKK